MAEAARRVLEPDFPGLVPATLRDALHTSSRVTADGSRPPRSPRDWTIDSIAFVLAFLLGAVVLLGTLDSASVPVPPVLLWLDVVGGLASCAALWLRRRWPVGVALFTAVAATVSASSLVAGSFALFAVAVHRRVAVVLVPYAVAFAASFVFWWLRPQEYNPLWLSVVLTVVALSALLAWGMFVRARRQLVWSLRERAVRAEEQQHLLAEQARLAERARIAREMHDVVAHRVSLVALQAGGLEVRPDLPPEEVARSAAAISAAARSALEELRVVVGVLRDGSAAPQAPQPTLLDVEGLVVAAREAGAPVQLEMDVAAPASAPGPLGRDAYRVVQEALTNASKHGGGAAVVVLRGGPGAGLDVAVRNPLRLEVLSADALPGAGAGLIGLAERVGLAGGTLSYGPAGRDFVVEAHLPWPG